MIEKNGFKYLTKEEVKEKYEVTDEELKWLVDEGMVKTKVLRYQTHYELGGITYNLCHRKLNLVKH